MNLLLLERLDSERGKRETHRYLVIDSVCVLLTLIVVEDRIIDCHVRPVNTAPKCQRLHNIALIRMGRVFSWLIEKLVLNLCTVSSLPSYRSGCGGERRARARVCVRARAFGGGVNRLM